VAEVLLAIFGLQGIVAARFRKYVPGLIAAAFLCIDLLGVHTLLIPYYAGFIAHVPGTDTIHAAGLRRLWELPKSLVLQRLTVNRPGVLGPEGILLLWVLYLLASAVPILVCYFNGRQKNTVSAAEIELQVSAPSPPA
jgi:hypothetical protein